MNYANIVEEINILSDIKYNGFIYRKFMSNNEVILANKLTKMGYLYKSKSDEKGATVAYFITKDGENFLEKN